MTSFKKKNTHTHRIFFNHLISHPSIGRTKYFLTLETKYNFGQTIYFTNRVCNKRIIIHPIVATRGEGGGGDWFGTEITKIEKFEFTFFFFTFTPVWILGV